MTNKLSFKEIKDNYMSIIKLFLVWSIVDQRMKDQISHEKISHFSTIDIFDLYQK